MKNRICLCLDLVDSQEAIKAYEHYHEPGNVWPEVIQSLFDSGIIEMEIYRCHNRLFMILEVNQSFTLEKKAEMDYANIKVQEWETLMRSNFQQALPWKNDMSWGEMKSVFKLESGE